MLEISVCPILLIGRENLFRVNLLLERHDRMKVKRTSKYRRSYKTLNIEHDVLAMLIRWQNCCILVFL